MELLEAITAVQWTAIDDWVRRGGACVISLGAEAQRLSGIPELAAMLPGTITGVGRINNPAALESLVATNEPLDAFDCSIVEPDRGRAELTLNDCGLCHPLVVELLAWAGNHPLYCQRLGTNRF